MAEKVFDQVFRTRGMTSLLYALCWIAALFLHPWFFLAVMALALFACTREFERMLALPQHGTPNMSTWLNYIFAGILLFEYLSGTEFINSILYILMALSLVLGLYFLIFSKGVGVLGSLKSFRLLYPGMGILATALITFPGGSITGFTPLNLMSLLVLIWANDSYAYMAGRAWGKHPLWASVSPKKTWEGTIGGAVGTLFTAWLWTLLFSSPDIGDMLVAALVVSIFGPLGDLFESKVKRAAGVKDSGNWLPGHGGLLDRFDSLLWVAPAQWLISGIIFP